MKLSVDRKALADATKAAAKFLPRMSHMAVLEHLHLEAHSNQLMVSATNLDAGRTVEVEADIEVDGRILVPATFPLIAAKARGKDLTLEATIGDVSISDGKSRWKLDLGKIEDYPEFSHDTDGEAEIESWTRIQAVATHAARSSRPALEGVQFGDGYAVATDSYRMAWTACDAPEALIPAYAIQNVDDVRTLQIGQKHAAAVLSDGLWWSRLIDAKFPDWKRLAEASPEVSAVVVSDVLTDALGRAALVAPEAGKKIKGKLATLEVGDGITVRAGDNYSETIPADTAGEIEASFNISYLVDAVAPVEKATLRFTDAFKPLLIESDWWNALIMPVRM